MKKNATLSKSAAQDLKALGDLSMKLLSEVMEDALDSIMLLDDEEVGYSSDFKHIVLTSDKIVDAIKTLSNTGRRLLIGIHAGNDSVPSVRVNSLAVDELSETEYNEMSDVDYAIVDGIEKDINQQVIDIYEDIVTLHDLERVDNPDSDTDAAIQETRERLHVHFIVLQRLLCYTDDRFGSEMDFILYQDIDGKWSIKVGSIESMYQLGNIKL